MTPRKEIDHKSTHFVASEIHLALFRSGMTIADLSKEIGESQAFIRRILEGEDGLHRLINILLLKKIADATGCAINIKISPLRRIKMKPAVKSEDAL